MDFDFPKYLLKYVLMWNDAKFVNLPNLVSTRYLRFGHGIIFQQIIQENRCRNKYNLHKFPSSDQIKIDTIQLKEM